MKTIYSDDYSPPAPVLNITLAVPDQAPRVGPYSALIDTGADGTFIPTAILERLTLSVIYTTIARVHIGGSRQQVSVYELDILFDTNRLPNVEVVADDWGNEIILGRNFLNKLRLHLDGPKQITELK